MSGIYTKIKFNVINFFKIIKETNFKAPAKLWILVIIVLLGMGKMALYYHERKSTNAMLLATEMVVVGLVWHNNKLHKRVIMLEKVTEGKDEGKSIDSSKRWRNCDKNQTSLFDHNMEGNPPVR